MIHFRLINPYNRSRVTKEINMIGASKHRLTHWSRFYYIAKPCEQIQEYQIFLRKKQKTPSAVLCGLYEVIPVAECAGREESELSNESTAVLRSVIQRNELMLVLTGLWLMMSCLHYFDSKTKSIFYLVQMILFAALLLFSVIDLLQAYWAVKAG